MTTINDIINELNEIQRKHGNVEVLGYLDQGWFSSAMGTGELARKKTSEFQRYVVALREDVVFDRD